MKLIQLLGSRPKSDFALFLGHTIAALGYRVLIVDATNNKEYLHSYIHAEENEYLYELQDVEILTETRSMSELVLKLSNSNESFQKFDCIIVDANDSSTIVNDWPVFQHVLYVSDNTRFNINQDIEILNDFVDSTRNTTIQRIHFESAYRIPNDYLDLLINNRLEFQLVEEPLEYDEQEHKLRNYMQHEGIIPYKKLPKDYKRLLKTIVTEIYDIGNKDFEASTRRNPFDFLFSRLRKKDKNEKLNVLVSEDEKENQEGQSKPMLVLSNVNHSGNKMVNKSEDEAVDNKKTKEYIGG